MLLIECALILEQFKIPPVLLMARITSFDIVSTLHRLYPAFMNGYRCIVGAFVVDHKSRRIEALLELSESVRCVTLRATNVIQGTEVIAQSLSEGAFNSERDSTKSSQGSSMRDALLSVQRSGTFDTIVSAVQQKAAIVLDPILLHKQDRQQGDFSWLRNTVIYLIARFVIIRSSSPGRRKWCNICWLDNWDGIVLYINNKSLRPHELDRVCSTELHQYVSLSK